MLILNGERAPKKRGFLVKVFQKVPTTKNAFLVCFFKILPAAHKVWPKQGLEVFWVLCLKKGRQIFSKLFRKSAPPPPHGDKTLDQPLGRSFRFLEMPQTILKTRF